MSDALIALRNSAGLVVAEAVIDDVDAHLAQLPWYRLGGGYVVRTETHPRRMLYLHRVIMGNPPGKVDHRDRDKLNNRRDNLRLATTSQNGQNRGPNVGRQYRGVGWHGASGKWRAYAKLDGKAHHLGVYDTPEEAADVAAAWRAQHMPFSLEVTA